MQKSPELLGVRDPGTNAGGLRLYTTAPSLTIPHAESRALTGSSPSGVVLQRLSQRTGFMLWLRADRNGFAWAFINYQRRKPVRLLGTLKIYLRLLKISLESKFTL